MHVYRTVLAAVIGDIIGRNYECSIWQGASFQTARCIGYDREPWWEDRTGACAETFDVFDERTSVTDDSLMTLCIAQWLLDGGDLRQMIQDIVCQYPGAGWGAYLKKWALARSSEPCGSFGNGGAMRVSPVAYVAKNLSELRQLAYKSTVVTHSVDHALQGAHAAALAVFTIRSGLQQYLLPLYPGFPTSYDLLRTLNEVRHSNVFSSKCPDTVPVAIRAFVEAENFEETIRMAISVGGDTDTIAAMAASIAGAKWGVPAKFYDFGMDMLPSEFRSTVERFDARFCTP